MKTIIHPGFGKAATSSLQYAFSKHAQINSIGRPFTSENYDFKCMLEKPSSNESSLLEKKVKLVTKKNNVKCVIFSDEVLIKKEFHSRQAMAERLCRVFSGAQVIFTIRNQFTSLISYYSNHGRLMKGVPEPYNGKFVSMENWLGYEFDNLETNYLGLIDYNSSIQMYEELFGYENVHVLLYEHFVHDYDMFCKKLCYITGVDESEMSTLLSNSIENPRPSKRAMLYTKIRGKFPCSQINSENSFFRRLFRGFIHSGVRYEPNLSDSWKNKLLQLYGNGNKILSEKYQLNLNKYNYPVEK